MINEKHFILALFFCVLLSTYIFKIDDYEGKKKKINEKLSKSEFKINILIIILVNIVFYFFIKNKKTIESLNKANVAFIIAFFAYIEIITTPFWLVLILSYYTQLV